MSTSSPAANTAPQPERFRRILCMDGGPAAVTYVRCLALLTEETPQLIGQADLFAGTSAGAFCAALFARHLPKEPTDQEILDVMAIVVDFNVRLIRMLTPDKEGYERLLLGTGAMVADHDIVEFMEREDVLGKDTLLGDLNHPVILVATRTNAPWLPNVQCNFGPDAEPTLRLVDAVMRSTAFPLLLPGWQAHADGAMFANNPSSIALAWARAGRGLSDDVMLLSFGGDDGSSDLSNQLTPHSEDYAPGEEPEPDTVIDRVIDSAPVQIALEVGHKIEDALSGVLGDDTSDALGGPAAPINYDAMRAQGVPQRIIDKVQSFAASTKADEQKAAERISAAAEQAAEMEERVRRQMVSVFGSHTHAGSSTDDPIDDWGWRAWLTYLPNPLYALQVFLNSQGRGTHEIVRRIMGDTAILRIAPVGMVPTNVLMLAMVLNLPEFALVSGEFASQLWAFPLTNELLNFKPSLSRTTVFVERWLVSAEAD